MRPEPTPRQGRILRFLWAADGPATVAEMREETGWDATALSNLLRSLESSDLVARKRGRGLQYNGPSTPDLWRLTTAGITVAAWLELDVDYRAILPHLESGLDLKAAAERAGLAVRSVVWRRRTDAEYDALVIEAAERGGRRLRPLARATCPSHCGTPTGYDYGCRKDACRTAKSAKVIEARKRRA